tara:strand:- start:194 stop:622 length:429 start_codon:yes stop_codon:yes gene_type:complete
MQRFEIWTRIIEIFIIIIGCSLFGKKYGFEGIGLTLILASFSGVIFNLFCYKYYLKNNLLPLFKSLIPGIIFSAGLLLSILAFDLFFQNFINSQIALLFLYFFIAILVFISLFTVLFYSNVNFFGLDARKLYKFSLEQFNLK